MSTSYSVANKMEGLFFQLWRDGVFSPTIGGNIFAGVDYNSSTTRQYYTKHFNMNAVDYQWKPLCALDLFGMISGSIVQQQVIGPLSTCANNRDCWSTSSKYNLFCSVKKKKKLLDRDKLLLVIFFFLLIFYVLF